MADLLRQKIKVEGHIPIGSENIISHVPDESRKDPFARVPSLSRTADDVREIALDNGAIAEFISISNMDSVPSPSASGPVGYCWPGHSEIEDRWKSNQFFNYHQVWIDSLPQLLPPTLTRRESFDQDGNGKGYGWHNLSAGRQLGKLAVYTYGAIASCLGSTRWWVSYRPNGGSWSELVDGWECRPGRTGYCRILARSWVDRSLFNLITTRGYYRFDIRFRAESDNGAFHRYFVGFGTYPDP